MTSNGVKAQMSYPLAAVLTLVGMVITGLTTFYGVRDQAVASCRAEIQQVMGQMRLENRQDLTHYVSREDWSVWKEQNRARGDAQYYELMTAIQRIGVRLTK